jgi:Cu/Zn superoxide dismutase
MFMKKIAILILAVGFFSGCEKEYVDADQVTARESSVAEAQSGFQATAILSGDNEVPVRDTQARGVATFHLNKEGTELYYRLNVANIDNVVGAHIHRAPEGTNGPIVVPLYSGTAAGGAFNGRLAEGTITSANLTGPLTGMTLADLVTLLQSGNAYVNVHTNDGVAPTNTGPGDFPGGEIRGQIKANDQ